MLFQVFSDIHLELMKSKKSVEKLCSHFPVIENSKENYLILAGDIGKVTDSNFQKFIEFCSNSYKDVFYVLGNHEFYSSHTMDSIKQRFTELFSRFENVHLLDNSFIKIGDYTIYGFTCWTRPIFDTTLVAREYLNDYNKIKTKSGKLSIHDHSILAEAELAKFKEFYSQYDSDKLIVVTHFPPISVYRDNDKFETTSNPEYLGDMLNSYFAWTNIFKSEDIDPNKIKIWISGHTHWSYDFNYQNVRLYANQIGYIGENVDSSNGFIEIL